MRRYKQRYILVRGGKRPLVIEDDPRTIAYFTLQDEELTALRARLTPITFPPSQDVPVGYAGEINNLVSTAVLMAEALWMLYADSDLRQQALPEFLSPLAGPDDAVMSGVGFDFLVGRHLERPMLLEAAAFGPEFVSSAIMAEFYGIRTLEERLSTWWHTLVEPCLHGAKSLHYVTSFGDFNFTHELEHKILIPYLIEQGIKATSGPAECDHATQAEAVYIRIGLQFPQVWRLASQTLLWQKILGRDVRVIPPIGNNFFSSKYWHPFFANPEELEKRGVSTADAKRIAAHMPVTIHFSYNLLQLLRRITSPQHPFFLKSIWNYGAYGTRRVANSSKIGKALREIRAWGETPIIVQEEIPPGFLPFDPERNLPDRRIEARVRVFYHKEGNIKAMPPSVRVYFPGETFPLDALYLDHTIIPRAF